MEQLEEVQAQLEDVRAQLAGIEEQGAVLVRTRDEKAAALGAELESIGAERKQVVSGVPADLLALYDRLRDQKEGVGAAALRARRCSGCSLELNPADLAAIKAKPSDEVVRCEECSRILVRTSESGL
jgi:predicted  nucleic acid-binding Zn-ribbon protein